MSGTEIPGYETGGEDRHIAMGETKMGTVLSIVSDWIIDRALRRDPDFVIGGKVDPYLNRWWIIPRNSIFNIYLHQFIRSDEDRALHDHPWPSLSLMLRGRMAKLSDRGWRDIQAGQWRIRSPWFAHSLQLPQEMSGLAWTLFITGPRLRSWGFHCPKGWVHWRDFTAGVNGEIVGRGCGD